MIAKDYHEVGEAVAAMHKFLSGLGVLELTTFGNVTRPAELFAEAVLLECSSDRVEELARNEPEQASAFLTVLGDILAELSWASVMPVLPATDAQKIHNLSAEAVLYAVKARRKRDEGYSGMYCSFPKD